METLQTVEEWKEMLKPALESKVSEFQMMGYSKATSADVWDCLVKKVWKGNPEKRLYEVVQDIFHLDTTLYMSYLTVNAYQEEEDMLTSIAALTGGGVK